MGTARGIAALVLVALAALACARPAATADAPRFATAGDHEVELAFGGAKRSAIVHLPPGFASGKQQPVLLAFHGGGGNAPGYQKYAGLDAPADARGWVVVYPNGSGRFAKRLLTWNAGACCGWAQEQDVDDVGFALALLADLARDLPLDRTRVYATGHSNGAMMSYRLAAEAATRVAAIAPVAGADMTTRFAPAAPVAVLHVHSVDDPRAPFAGGEGPRRLGIGPQIEHRAVEAGLARWRERDGCRGAGSVVDTRASGGHTATLLDFGPCAADSEVALWKLTGAGHGWPGGESPLPERIIGPRTDVIRAADEIFRFLPRFAKPDAPPLDAR